jgi:hypothetical protein
MNTQELVQSRGDLNMCCKSIESAGSIGRLELLQADVGPVGVSEGEVFGRLLLGF